MKFQMCIIEERDKTIKSSCVWNQHYMYNASRWYMYAESAVCRVETPGHENERVTTFYILLKNRSIRWTHNVL